MHEKKTKLPHLTHGILTTDTIHGGILPSALAGSSSRVSADCSRAPADSTVLLDVQQLHTHADDQDPTDPSTSSAIVLTFNDNIIHDLNSTNVCDTCPRTSNQFDLHGFK